MINRTARTPRFRPERGFALPVVLVVMVVLSSLIAIMLERQSADQLLAERQLVWYQEHHARYGVEEVLAAWLRTVPRNVTLLDALGPDGHAVDLNLRDGTVAEVFVRDGQGAVLTNFEALAAEDLPWARELAARYGDLCAASRVEPRIRAVGPATLSVSTAPPEALRAAIEVLLPDADANLAVSIILSRRTSSNGAEVLREVQTALALTTVERQRLARALAPTPTLHLVEVRLRSARGARAELARFGGNTLIERTRTTGDGMWTSRSAFLDWGPLAVVE